MKSPHERITDDLPRLRAIVEGILNPADINTGIVAADIALLGNLALSVAVLRNRSCWRGDRAEALRNAIFCASALMTMNESGAGAHARIAADMCLVAGDPGPERWLTHNRVSRKERAGRLQEVLDEALLAKARDNRDALLAHLARWVTLCTLWVALILDEKEPE